MNGFVRILMFVATFLTIKDATAQSAAVALDPVREEQLSSMLDRPARLKLEGTTLEAALNRLSQASGVPLAFSPSLIGAEARPVECDCEGATVREALEQLLQRTKFGYREFRGEVMVFRDVPVIKIPSPDRFAIRLAMLGGLPAELLGHADALVQQVGSVSGRVTDAESGEGIAAVDVWLDGTKLRTTTNAEGRFLLNAVNPGTYNLRVRRIGYAAESRSVTVAAGQAISADFALRAAPTQLDEIVATVTGEQRLRELGHVVGRIKADSVVREAPVSSVSELLTGRVAGLQVFQVQGTVGGTVKLQVRGMNSLLLDSEPIVIIDGMRYSNRPAQMPCGGSSLSCQGPGVGAEAVSPLNDLNPNDIASIEVVKGPSAATLYGTDAANGVIVITTKRGQPGPARWNAYTRYSINEIPRPKYQDNWFGWGTFNGTPNTTNCALEYIAAGWCTQVDSVTAASNPLNRKEYSMFGHAPRKEVGVSVSGGTAALRYNLSGGYEDAQGAIKTPDLLLKAYEARRGTRAPDHVRRPNTLDRLNLRANVTAHLGDRADLNINSGYTHGNTRSLQASPFYASFAEQTPDLPYGRYSSPEDQFAANSVETTDRFLGGLNLQWRPADWLATRASAGIDIGMRSRTSLMPRGGADHASWARDGSVQEDRFRQFAMTGDIGATGTVRWERMSSRTSVGVQYVRNLSDGVIAQGIGLPPGGSSVAVATSVRTSQSYTETVTLGSYLEQTVGLNERLFLTGALRMDGASTFGSNYRAVVYPKVSASWLVSEEPFLPRIPGLDELRLRYAYGASGQQPLPAWGRPSFSATSAFVDNAATTVLRHVNLGNPNIKPERIREGEGGIDLAVLDRRLNAGLTWYRRRTVDQIATLAQAPGLGGIYGNIGLTKQSGFEAEIGAQVLTSSAISWDLRFMHSEHRTKVVDLGTANEVRYWDIGSRAEGYPIGARFGLPYLGYDDRNGDGIIVPGEVLFGTEMAYAGVAIPPVSQTLTTMFGLFEQQVRLSALVERRTGFTQFNDLARSRCMNQRCRERVDPTTPLEEQARAAAASGYTTFFEPGDFTRLREVSLAADLPQSLVGMLRVRSATMSLAVRNLGLWTKYSGPDPESDKTSIPQSRAWTIRLDLGF